MASGAKVMGPKFCIPHLIKEYQLEVTLMVQAGAVGYLELGSVGRDREKYVAEKSCGTRERKVSVITVGLLLA